MTFPSPAKPERFSPPLRIGIAGMGAAGRAFLAPLLAHPGFELAAFADPSADTRAEVGGRHGLRAYGDLAGLLGHPGLDAVYIATPTRLHPEQVAQAAAAGKHVLVEKPMAVTLAQTTRMIEAAEAAGVILLVGHSHSYDLPVREMRRLIDGGELGRVMMANTWCFTDWIYRPRRPDELLSEEGGGVTFRQGAHQFDILRLLCGGRARSVRAKTFDADPARRAVGAHVAYLDFEDGPAATAVYNGYGGLASAELCFGIGEWGHPAAAPARPGSTAMSPEAVLEAKRQRAKSAIPASAPHQPFFGLTVVHCERGDIRQSPQGLHVYAQGERRDVELPTGLSPRDLVVAEFHDAIRGLAPAVHDGRWGRANLEVCAAAIESAAARAEVMLRFQVPAPPDAGRASC